MSDRGSPTSYPAENDFEGLSSEEIEVRAIEDATSERFASFSDAAADSQAAIEYREKRQLATDEEDNVDPAVH